jgi:fructokinase
MGNLYGGIEAGGTKFVCAVGSGPDEIAAEARFPTTTPTATFQKVIAFFQGYKQTLGLSAIGIGSFGPLDLNPQSPTYGSITKTTKSGWSDTVVAGTIQEALALPVVFETDVNAAAYGEHCWGAAKGLSDFIYLTIGTGIGGGLMTSGQLVHGLIHPEMGHIRLPHDFAIDPFPGLCSFHGDCFEGLASGPAVGKRWGVPAEKLPPDHPAWPLEATYIAHALADFICTLSPQRIVMGGGVMEQAHLFPMVRRSVTELLNGYIRSKVILEEIESFIVPPALGKQAGVLGAIGLAKNLAERG